MAARSRVKFAALGPATISAPHCGIANASIIAAHIVLRKDETGSGSDTMNDQQRRDAGMAQRRKVLGDAWVDKSVANQNSFNAEFVDLITRHAWADIWTRPHFDHRTRRVLVIGTLVALGQWDEFRLHVRAALTEGGFSPDDIKEIILQQAIYCGVPAANHAVKEALAIVQELGLLKG